MAQLEAVGKVICACPRNVAVGIKIIKWVYICSSCEASETPKAKGSYSVISCDSDSSYTMDLVYVPMPHLPRIGHGWRLLGICKNRLTNSPPLGTILCYKSPTWCIRIPKTIKVLGQMPHLAWGQIMLTNHCKSPPIAWPGVGGAAACFQSLKPLFVNTSSFFPLFVLKWKHGKQKVASLSIEYSNQL